MEFVTTKTCATCEKQLPLTAYFPRSDGRDYLQAHCKTCQRKHTTARGRVWRKANPEKARDATLRSTYNITLEDYNELLKEQGSVCGICYRSPAQVGTLAVDHCHITGSYRGLLCRLCNLGLGHFFENPKLLQDAATYLLEHRALVERLMQQKLEKDSARVAFVNECIKDLSV